MRVAITTREFLFEAVVLLTLLCSCHAFVSPLSTKFRSETTELAIINDIDFIMPATLVESSNLVSAANPIVQAIQSESHPFQYAFMFPTMTLIAVCCQLAGIGGAALLSPVVLLIFPLLGPDYPLSSTASGIASSLLTEVFGFASGLAGYSKRGLVDWRVAIPYIILSVPAALAGALLTASVASNPTVLRGIYASLMIGLSVYLTLSESSPEQLLLVEEEECDVPPEDASVSILQKQAADGTSYSYLKPRPTVNSVTSTLSGSLLTGLLGVGIGEVVLPQLVRIGCMPLPIAAGTSVAVVVVTALTAAVVQFGNLASQVMDGSDKSLFQGLVQVIPWELVQFTIPGALLGGQIAPFLAARKVLDDETIERFAATLFGIIGIAFALKIVTSIN